MSPTDFLAFIAGIGSGAAIGNTEIALRVLALLLENPDVNIKHKRGKASPVIEIRALVDLEKITNVKQV